MIGWLQGEFEDLDIKYLKQNISKKSVGNIRKLQEKFRCTMQNGCEIFTAKGQHFRSKRVISQPCKILPLAWSDRFPMAVTPSFQLRITHRLKHWIYDFLRFETTYRMHKLDSRKCSKSG